MNALLGTHIQPVYGYDTSSKVMALLSGEIALTSGTASSLFGVMDSPDVKVLLFTTKGSESPRFGDVPSLAELAPPEGRRILDFFDTVHLYGRLILGPPGMPPDIVQAWREVFLAVVNDPAFIAEAKTPGPGAGATSGLRGGRGDRPAVRRRRRPARGAQSRHRLRACPGRGPRGRLLNRDR